MLYIAIHIYIYSRAIYSHWCCCYSCFVMLQSHDRFFSYRMCASAVLHAPMRRTLSSTTEADEIRVVAIRDDACGHYFLAAFRGFRMS